MITRSVRSSGQIKNSINDHVNGPVMSSDFQSSSPRTHQLDKEIIRGSISLPETSTATTSCPEFRNGYRLQRRAYERSQTPTLAAIINNRSPKNAYVDRLKEFYNMDDETDEPDPNNGASLRLGESLSVKRMSTSRKHAPEIKSILRLPETKTYRSAKAKNTVKLVLPSDSPTAFENNSAQGYRTKIPPPAPVLLSSFQSRKGAAEGDLSSSLSSDFASSILAAVNESKMASSNSPQRPQRSHQYQRRKRQYSTKASDPSSLAMKMTLPCRIGCCYCVYSSILGPVKIFMTRSQRPKQGPWLAGIRDGNGRLVIPVSRKSDVTGLVYDAHSHSLHPPAKGERPLFPSTNVSPKEKAGVKEQRGSKTSRSNRKEINKRS